MGEITVNPFAMTGVNASSEGAGFAAEGGVAVTRHVEGGGLEAFLSGTAGGSYTGGETRVTASGTITGMLVWPFLKTAGPRVSYNVDEKSVEVGALLGLQTLIPVSSNTGVFGGLFLTANDVTDLRGDGVNILLTATGQF